MWRDINKVCVFSFSSPFSYFSASSSLSFHSPFSVYFIRNTYSCNAISEMSVLDLARGDLNSTFLTEQYSEALVILSEYCLCVVICS